MRVAAAVVLLALVLTGCGDGAAPGAGETGDGVPVRVRGSVERAGEGWRLCPAGEPPCWEVDGSPPAIETDAGDEVVVEGRWLDGNVVHIDRLDVVSDPGFPNPCPDARTTSEGDVVSAEVRAYLDTIPDEFAGFWLARPGPVLVVAVTGHADRHQAALPGACVTADGFRYTQAELREAGDDLAAQQNRWQEEGWTPVLSHDEVTRNRYVARFDLVDHRLVDEARQRWGGRVAVEGHVEVLEGTLDDIDLPPAPASAITIDTIVRGSMHMAALGTFVLRHDTDHDCLYLEAGDAGRRMKPVWPAGSYVVADPVRVLDGRGAVVATVDEPFQTGGGVRPLLGADDPLACGATEQWIM